MSSRLSILPLCLLILFVTTSVQATPVVNNIFDDADAVTQYSGTDIFRGIYFSQGPVADRIPALKAFDLNRFVKDDSQRKAAEDFQNQAMDKVEREHGDFLVQLENAVASKNNYKIRDAISQGNEILLNITSELTGQERDAQKEAALKAEIAKTVDLEKASSEEIGAAMESLAAEAIVIDFWVLLPVCIVVICMYVVWIANIELSADSLFQEEIVSGLSKL